MPTGQFTGGGTLQIVAVQGPSILLGFSGPAVGVPTLIKPTSVLHKPTGYYLSGASSTALVSDGEGGGASRRVVGRRRWFPLANQGAQLLGHFLSLLQHLARSAAYAQLTGPTPQANAVGILSTLDVILNTLAISMNSLRSQVRAM